jgi:hypothetical protein
MPFSDKLYSFDECTVLNSFAITLPSGIARLYGKSVLKSRNHDKIATLLSGIRTQGRTPHRFIPSSNLDHHLFLVGEELIETAGLSSAVMMFKTLKITILDQLNEHLSTIQGWATIEKCPDFEDVHDLFISNERPLTKAKRGCSNIPEDDDCKILKGLMKFQTSDDKLLITADEHFWGYKDIIQSVCSIHIVEEWACHLC